MNRPRSAHLIYLVVFIDLVGFGLVIPQLGVYAKLFNASGAVQGLLVASYSVVQFLFTPLLGRWSDRFGRRPVLIASLFTTLLGYILFAVAHNLTLLFASRLIDGLGGANISTAQAYIADITPSERRAAAMGKIGMAFGLGFILGPAIGAAAGPLGAHWWGPHGSNLAIGGLAAILSGITLLLALFGLGESLPPESRHTARGSLKLIDWHAVRTSPARDALSRLMIIMFVATAGYAVLHAILTFFIIDTLGLDVTRQTGEASKLAGFVFAWQGLLMAFIQGGMIRHLVKRHGETSLTIVGLGLHALGLGLMPFSHNLTMLFITSIPLACGSALNSATLPALITFYSPAQQRGELLGLSHAMGSLGRIVGPLMGGLLYDKGHMIPFQLGMAICFGAMLISLGLRRDKPGEIALAPPDDRLEVPL